ncbi:MAG: SMC-Scp complex subunit ScpB [Angustibacter sp.]
MTQMPAGELAPAGESTASHPDETSDVAERINHDVGRHAGHVDGQDADHAVSHNADEQSAFDVDATPSGARGAVEALLMVTDAPLAEVQLAHVVGRPVAEVSGLIRSLADEYDEQGRGFELKEVGGGWRLLSRAEYAPIVERMVIGGQQARLTQAALETLAVIAYRQPVSRARVGAVRGVSVDGVIRTLMTRGLIEEAGSDDDTGAILYATTSLFLERLGLSTLDDLPALAPHLPEVDALDDLAEQGVP